MAGDRALSMLIDIRARDSASSIVRSLGGILTGLANPFKLIAQGAKTAINSMDYFIHGFPATGMLNLKKGLADVVKGFEQLAVAALKVIAIFGLIAVAVGIAIGVAAVKAAGDFQQGLNRLVTGAGDVTDNMNLMGESILGVSTATGVLTDKLLPAMYQIISAGQRGAEAENTLGVAARGAVAEQANVVDVAKALTTAMTDYGTAQFNATQFMNGYTRAVQLGKITLEELSNSMGPILPLARNLGVSFADVAAAMSTMTNAGIPAQRAATSLRFMFQSLENPTKKASTAMTEFGLNTVAVANEMKKSLPGALQMIYDAAKRAGPEGSVPFNRAASDMIGGQRSLQAFLSLTGGHFKTYVENTKKVTAAMDASKTAVLGWDTAQKNFNVKLDQGKAAMQAVFIAIGTQLVPVLGHLADVITPLVQHFADWVNNAKPLSGFINNIIDAFNKVFGPAKEVNKALSPLADTFDRAGGALHLIKSNAQPVLDAFDRASGVFHKTHDAINPLVGVLQWLKEAFNKTKEAAIFLWNGMMAIAKVISDWLSPLFQALVKVIQTVVIPAWNMFVAAIKPHLPELLLLAQIIGVILVVAFIIVAGIILGVIIAVGLVIAAFLFLVAIIIFVATWVHDRIQWLVQKVVEFFKWLWQQLIGGSIIPDIVNGIIKWFTKARDFLVNLWNTVINWIVDQWTRLKVKSAALWTEIVLFIQTKLNQLKQAVLNIIGQAVAWGQNLVNNILKGIQSAWAGLISWVQGALANLKGLFPGSPVEHGPLKGYETWGYTFGMGIADGIRRSIPAVQSASLLLAASMGGNYQGSYSLSGSSFGGGRYPTGGVTVVHNHIVVMPPDVKLDGASVTDRIMQRAGTDVRRHGGPIKWG